MADETLFNNSAIIREPRGICHGCWYKQQRACMGCDAGCNIYTEYVRQLMEEGVADDEEWY